MAAVKTPADDYWTPLGTGVDLEVDDHERLYLFRGAPRHRSLDPDDQWPLESVAIKGASEQSRMQLWIAPTTATAYYVWLGRTTLHSIGSMILEQLARPSSRDTYCAVLLTDRAEDQLSLAVDSAHGTVNLRIGGKGSMRPRVSLHTWIGQAEDMAVKMLATDAYLRERWRWGA